MIGPNGQPLQLGLPPLIVTPARADLSLDTGHGPDGAPAVLVTLKLTGYPLWFQVPVPRSAWDRLVAGLGSAEAAS